MKIRRWGGMWCFLLRARRMCALLLVAGAVCAGQSAVSSRLTPGGEKMVARVNHVAIKEADVEDRVESLYPVTVAHGGLRPEKLAELRSQAIRDLVIEELAWQRAVRSGQVVSLSQAREEQRRWRLQYGAPAFDQELSRRGLTRQQYVKNLQRQLTVRRMVERAVAGPSRMSEPGLRQYYQRNLAKFNRPERVRIRLILISLEPDASPDAERAAKKKIDELYQQLKAGKDFGELAHQYSEDMYRVKGGDVGWMHKGSMDPEFEPLAFRLPVGEFSAPLRTPAGYNLLKVEAREPGRQLQFEEVRSRIKAELEEKKSRELRQAWEAGLTSNASIEFLEGTGAGGLATASPVQAH